MAHAADRILAAVLANLAAVPGIQTASLKPLYLLEETDLPALVIDDVEDEVTAADGFDGYFPVSQSRRLNFVVQVCAMSGSQTFLADVADLHEKAAIALVGSELAVKLGGLLTRGLTIHGGSMFTDSESLQKPVGGWRISVSCTYNLSSESPGKTEKE